MSVQRYTLGGGLVRYRVRVKHHGREIVTRVFDRKRDAEAWEDDQKRKLRLGEWTDPRRGRVPLALVAEDWVQARASLKHNTRTADRVAWKRHIEPRFGNAPVASISTADVAGWVGRLVSNGARPATASRHLAVFRSLLDFAVHDGRVTVNVAAAVRAPTAGRVRREGYFLTVDQVSDLVGACRGAYAELVWVLALGGLRWGELAGLQVGDRVSEPGAGLRLQRSLLASSREGEPRIDTLKTNRARTVPLIETLIPLVDRWSAGKNHDDWMFSTSAGGPINGPNWKRAVAWEHATATIGKPGLRVHDLRHTCASVWLGAGADPKVVQRILGHASAAMTMDLYGHLIDQNLWDAATRVGSLVAHTDPIAEGHTL